MIGIIVSLWVVGFLINLWGWSIGNRLDRIREEIEKANKK